MIVKRRSRIISTVFAFLVFYLVSRSLLRRAPEEEIQFRDVSNHATNKDIREVVPRCRTKCLTQGRPRNCKEKPLLLVVVSSSPNRLSHRNVLRRFWGTEMRNSNIYSEGPLWKVVFLVSKTNNLHLELKVKKETEAYGDVIWSR